MTEQGTRQVDWVAINERLAEQAKKICGENASQIEIDKMYWHLQLGALLWNFDNDEDEKVNDQQKRSSASGN